VSKESGIDGSGLNFGLSVAMGDVNNDGWCDLYVTNDYDEQDFCISTKKMVILMKLPKKALDIYRSFRWALIS
jgi:hypothetical protein